VCDATVADQGTDAGNKKIYDIKELIYILITVRPKFPFRGQGQNNCILRPVHWMQ